MGSSPKLPPPPPPPPPPPAPPPPPTPVARKAIGRAKAPSRAISFANLFTGMFGSSKRKSSAVKKETLGGSTKLY